MGKEKYASWGRIKHFLPLLLYSSLAPPTVILLGKICYMSQGCNIMCTLTLGAGEACLPMSEACRRIEMSSAQISASGPRKKGSLWKDPQRHSPPLSGHEYYSLAGHKHPLFWECQGQFWGTVNLRMNKERWQGEMERFCLQMFPPVVPRPLSTLWKTCHQ